MKFFDAFKKKPAPPQADDLSLEELIERAATQPAYRADFYKRLLSDKVVVLTSGSGLPEGEQVLKAAKTVNIVSLEDGTIPVFTSTDRIFDQQVVKEQVEFLQMKGEALFKMTRGARLVLNPYSKYGKELLPDEIERILNGTIMTATHKAMTIEKDTKVQIGEPSNYPSEIVAALCNLFAGKPQINAAYLAWIYNPESAAPPHYIFGLAASDEGNMQDIVNEAGATVNNLLPAGEFVDFIRVDSSGGLSDYFLGTEPFYKKL